MGHNNNNAGMHMVWRNRGSYDPGWCSEKDEFVPREWREGEEEEFDKKMRQDDEGTIRISEQSDGKARSRRNKKHHKNDDFFNKELKRKYGTDIVVEDKHFSRFSVANRNIIRIALEKGINILPIMKKYEKLINADKRINGKVTAHILSINIPEIDKCCIFLGMMADELNCSMADFFREDEENDRVYAYNLLKQIICFDDGYIDEKGNCEALIHGFGLPLSEAIKNRDEYPVDGDMPLRVCKQCYSDETVYSLSYGVDMIRPYEIIMKGAILWEETEGELCDLVEQLIIDNPDWRENVYF